MPNRVMDRPADIEPRHWAVMCALSDEWLELREVVDHMPGASARSVQGRLVALRTRGLVTFRPPDHDFHPVGQWALTVKGDKITWGVGA